MRRIAALALALRRRRVAGAGLDPDRQLHLGDRRLEVARDVDRERLQRRDIERVQPALAPHLAAGGDELACVRVEPAACSVRSPPPIRVANGGEGSGVGGGAIEKRSPPTPNPSPPPTLNAKRFGGGRGTDRARCAGVLKPRDAPLNSTSDGKNPASVLPAPVGAISSTERPARAFASSSSWCARGSQPRCANQRANGSGSVTASGRSRTVTR